MRGLMLLLVLGLASSDKLDRTYLPPPGAKLSGGNLGTIDVPLELPKQKISTTIKPRPKFPVKAEDTQLTVGIDRGQPPPTGLGFTPTPGSLAQKYTPSTTTPITYTQTTIYPSPEGFESTSSPIAPMRFPSEKRPGVYGQMQGQKLRPVYDPNGQIIGVTPTPGTVGDCKEGDVLCQHAQKVYPVYGPNGQIISQQVKPTTGKPEGLQPFYGEIATPGTIEACEEGDVRCQKQSQQNFPVYDPTSQIVGYQPSETATLGTVKVVQPVYDPNGEVFGQQATKVSSQTGRPIYEGTKNIYQPGSTAKPSGTVQICKEGNEGCQKNALQNIPVYNPNGQIVGYQAGVNPTPGFVQGPGTQGQQVIPVYGSNGEFVGYQPSVTPMPGFVQGFQPVSGHRGQIIDQQPTAGTVHVCKKDDHRCLKQAQQNVPVYGPDGQIFGYQATVKPGTVQNSGTRVQQIVPIYGSNRQIISFKPSVAPSPETLQVCKEGDERCQKQAQQNTSVYSPSRQIIRYQSSATPSTEQSPGTQGQQIIPEYGSHGQIVGYQVSPTPTPGTVQGPSKQGQLIVPVYNSIGTIIGYKPSATPSPEPVQCKEGDKRCQEQGQQNVPVYGSSGQIISYQPSVTSATTQGPGQEQQIPIYGPNGQIVSYQPNVTPSSGSIQGFHPVYDLNSQIIGQQPSPGTVQICKEGDEKCKKQAQLNVPMYDPSRQIIGYQPKPVYDSNTKIIGQRPAELVQGCNEGDLQCLNRAQQFIPLYGPSGQVIGQQSKVMPTPGQKNIPVFGPDGQVIGQQPSAMPTPGIVQDLKPVYDSNGKIIGQRPADLIKGCKEGDIQCQNQAQQFISIYDQNGQVTGQQPDLTLTPGTRLQPVYGSNGQIIGQQVAPTPKTVQDLRPVYGPNGQIIGQQPSVTQTPGSYQNLQPVYGPQQPTGISPTTGRPVYGGIQNLYQPESTVEPSITTPGYFQPSSVGTTPAPFRNLVTTPTGILATNIGSDSEIPLSKSDKNAVTLNYDIALTPDGYSYNFDTSNGIHVDETGIVNDGNKAVGSYSYIGDDGKKYQVTYKADENGFQPTGGHLPTSPPIPAAIQKVIKQAVKDKQAGISDDGSYDEAKYGHERYERPNRLQTGERQSIISSGHKPSKSNYDQNLETEEGYQYTPPKSKFPVRLPGRGQTKLPQGKYEESDNKFKAKPFLTPNLQRGDEGSSEEGAGQRIVPGKEKYDKETTLPFEEKVSDYDSESGDNYDNDRPGVSRPSNKPISRPSVKQGITTYRPTGTTQLDQVNNFGRPITSKPGQGIDRSTYRPAVSLQGQVDTSRRPIYSQPEDDNSRTIEPDHVDKYGRLISSRPGQGYGTTTYRTTGTPLQVDKFGRPIYSQPGVKSTETTQSGQVDKYGRPITSRPEQGHSTTPYMPTVSGQPTQVDKYGRPIYLQPGEEPAGSAEPGRVDTYTRPTPSTPGQEYRPTTYRPTETTGTRQLDAFGRPISTSSGQTDGNAEPVQVDQYGRPLPYRPGQRYSPTTYKTTETTGSAQLDILRRPVSYPPGEIAGSTPIPQLDAYGRPIVLRPGKAPSSTTYRPMTTTQTPGYQPGSEVSGPEGAEEKPDEFGPQGQKLGPAYLTPHKDKTGPIIGEDFRGPKQPPRFDAKTGYHY